MNDSTPASSARTETGNQLPRSSPSSSSDQSPGRPARNALRDTDLPWAMTPDPQDFVAGCWRELQRAVKDMRHGFRTGAIATVSADGAPSVRTVVLRWVDAGLQQLAFHVDRRSTKATEIQAQPQVAWL